MTARSRGEHLAWCQQRALAELDAHGPTDVRIVNALNSVQSDLRKHPDTAGHDAIVLSTMLASAGHLSTEQEVREWIEGIQ